MFLLDFPNASTRKLIQNIVITLLLLYEEIPAKIAFVSVMPRNILENNKKDSKSVLIRFLRSWAQLRESQKILAFLPCGERAEKANSHGLSSCYEITSQIRDGITNNWILNKNGCLCSPLVLLEFEVFSIEMIMLKAY